MNDELTPLLVASLAFAYVGAIACIALGVYSSVTRRRLHPLFLVCIAAVSISWIEGPYDWAVYLQFAPAIPRMPSWWPLDKAWGGLPLAVPAGYVAFFVPAAGIGAALGRRLMARYEWRARTFLAVGFGFGIVWAFVFNAMIGARLGVFRYGRVVPGLALWEGTKYQYPLFDALAMGVQLMVFTYVVGRTDADGQTLFERLGRSAMGSVAVAVLVAHLVCGAVFTPQLLAKLQGKLTAGPTEQLFEGVPNQPLHGP